jgi:hypothetical protein
MRRRQLSPFSENEPSRAAKQGVAAIRLSCRAMLFGVAADWACHEKTDTEFV